MILMPVLKILILSLSFLAVCTGVFCLSVAFGVIMKVRHEYGNKNK
jgi:hypothetical protein